MAGPRASPRFTTAPSSHPCLSSVCSDAHICPGMSEAPHGPRHHPPNLLLSAVPLVGSFSLGNRVNPQGTYKAQTCVTLDSSLLPHLSSSPAQKNPSPLVTTIPTLLLATLLLALPALAFRPVPPPLAMEIFQKPHVTLSSPT